MAILVKGYILPIGGVAPGRVCACSLRSRLVSSFTLIQVGEGGVKEKKRINRRCYDEEGLSRHKDKNKFP